MAGLVHFCTRMTMLFAVEDDLYCDDSESSVYILILFVFYLSRRIEHDSLTWKGVNYMKYHYVNKMLEVGVVLSSCCSQSCSCIYTTKTSGQAAASDDNKSLVLILINFN